MPDQGCWEVYMVQTRSGALYTGISTDVERRFRQHAGELVGGARYFRSDRPEAIVWRESHADRTSASRREAEIKAMPRKQKLALLATSGS